MKSACRLQSAAQPVAVHSAANRKPFFSAVQRKCGQDVQAKLRVGARGDRFEAEADRTADRVVNGAGAGTLAGGVSRIVQRAPAEEEPEVQTKGEPKDEEELQPDGEGGGQELAQAKSDEDEQEPEIQRAASPPQEREELQEREEDVQAKAVDADEGLQEASTDEEELQSKSAAPREEEEVQARSIGGGPSAVNEEVSRQIRASRGLGNPLPGDVRDKMSAAFGADVSGVRIHTDATAVLLARSLNAQAFTVGKDIYFADGKFSPGSREGQHLLAHELTHTIQQGAVEPDAGAATIVRLAPEANGAETYGVRPEIVEAIRLARGEIGKVNAKKTGADGKRVGWERLREYFSTAFGGPVVSEAVIDKLVMVEKTESDGTIVRMDALPSWCGIFTWWAMKKSGIPLPDWKLGAPALDAMKQRPPGSLPRKGDIAIDVVPNNHFAMVTGLESAEDAEGKPTKMIRVATVNGNTAGDDNLGGQVQERWDPVSRWDHFLDPVGKMSLPDAPLVTVGREPSEEAAGTPGEDTAPPDSAAIEAAAATDAAVGELEQDLPPPPSDMFAEAAPEPNLTLPPPVEAGPAEVVADVAKVDLGGSSDEATTAFIDAPPSAMAASQPEFGPAIDAKMKGEQKDLVDNPPQLAARTSGSVDVPLGSAEIPTPADTSLEGGVAPTGEGDLDKVSLPDPAPYRANAEREKELDEEDSGSFFDAFMSFLKKFTTGIKTKDDSIDTSAGERPAVDLSDDANPTAMADDQKSGTADLRAERDEHVASFKANPGQAKIQPKKVDETFAAPVSQESAATIEAEDDPSVREFAEAPLPADVRAKADAKVAEQMAPELADARTQTVEAATKRDTDKKSEIDTAEAAAAKINTDADADQRKIVVDNRAAVAKLQGDGIAEAYGAVNDFSEEATKKQGANRKEIGEHVKKEQGEAKSCLAKAEADAKAEKARTEGDAAEKKRKLDEEQKKRSWWDRVKDAVKSAVKAVTKWIDDAFNALRKFVKETIEKARNWVLDKINKARNWVVDKINGFRNWAKEQVDKYLKDTFPGLAKRINEGIDAVADGAIEGVNKAADWAIAKVNELAKALAAALDKILSTFQVALKTAVRVVGAVMQGDFAEALRAAIEGACEIAGIDPKTVFDFLDRAGKAIGSILKDPVGFIRKLFGAVGDGLRSFFKNIKKHLIEGVVGWLTCALSEVNLSGPFEFSPKGILKIVLEILGLTYANIKARVIKKVPAAAKVFDLVEQGVSLVGRLMTEGPGALWEEIKDKISSIKDTVMAAIRSWLITTVLKEGIKTLVMLTNPAGAIVKAIELLYKFVTFLIERYEQIKSFVMTVYEGLVAVASGNFSKVVTAVEDALARMVPVLISLLASLLGLGGIAKQVKKVIETITKPINKAIDWVVDKIVAFARKVVGKVKAGAKTAKEKAKATARKVKEFFWPKKKFTVEGESHTVYFETKAGKKVPYIQSTPVALASFVQEWENQAKPNIAPAKQEALASAKMTVASIATLAASISKLEANRQPVPDSDRQQMLTLQTALCKHLSTLLGKKDALAKGKARYKLEGLTGTYSTVPKPSGDYLTGDHQPQAAAIKFLAGRSYFQKPFGNDLRNRAAGKHAQNAYVINLQDARHKAGRTWGPKGGATKSAFESAVTKMEATEKKAPERRKRAIDLLKSELVADVSQMRAVYQKSEADPVWSDLNPIVSNDAKAKSELVKDIRDQVNSGLAVIAAQPMTELCE